MERNAELGQEALSTLVAHHLPLVVRMARRYRWSGVPVLDLFQRGREADAVILSYGSGDWYGPNAEEPFDEASRLLYVSITRARHVVIVMLPPTPHALVMPFLAYAGQ